MELKWKLELKPSHNCTLTHLPLPGNQYQGINAFFSSSFLWSCYMLSRWISYIRTCKRVTEYNVMVYFQRLRQNPHATWSRPAHALCLPYPLHELSRKLWVESANRCVHDEWVTSAVRAMKYECMGSRHLRDFLFVLEEPMTSEHLHKAIVVQDVQKLESILDGKWVSAVVSCKVVESNWQWSVFRM